MAVDLEQQFRNCSRTRRGKLLDRRDQRLVPLGLPTYRLSGDQNRHCFMPYIRAHWTIGGAVPALRCPRAARRVPPGDACGRAARRRGVEGSIRPPSCWRSTPSRYAEWPPVGAFRRPGPPPPMEAVAAYSTLGDQVGHLRAHLTPSGCSALVMFSRLNGVSGRTSLAQDGGRVGEDPPVIARGRLAGFGIALEIDSSGHPPDVDSSRSARRSPIYIAARNRSIRDRRRRRTPGEFGAIVR